MANGFQFLRPSSILAIFATALLTHTGRAQEDAPAKRVGIIFEGTFEKHVNSKKPADSELTQMVPYYEWDYGVRAFDESYWTKNRFTWERITAIAERLGDDLMEVVEPMAVRDDRGVIKYAYIKDKDPFLTSIILSKKLVEKFRDSMCDSLHVMLIDRHIVYIFPATGMPITDYGPALVDEYRAARLPVSLEVFLVDDYGFRVIGELER